MPAKFNLLSYLGGFFDGEGCIYITKRKRGNQQCYYLSASCSQKDRTVLNIFQNLFGGEVYRNSNKNEAWVWMIDAIKAKQFLEDFLPYLIMKAGEAKLAIEFQILKHKRRAGQRRTDAEKTVEKAQYFLMKKLKQRGYDINVAR